MRAVVYNGPRQVDVEQVPDARIEQPTDVLVRITTTNICGSDLHMYEGRTDFETGRILGHENLGEVVEIGPAVYYVRVGDMVCMPFNISCGFGENCEKGRRPTASPPIPSRAWPGRPTVSRTWGPSSGGQAELLRVPFGDVNCLVLRTTRRRSRTTT